MIEELAALHTAGVLSEEIRRDEPDDHGIGRSRGGLTTKTHALVDGRGRALVSRAGSDGGSHLTRG